MTLDPLAIRNLLIFIALAVGSALLLGGVPSWMRCAAKRADPSAAAALFTLLLALAGIGLLIYEGKLDAALSLDTTAILWLAACGFLYALTWLSLFTALTGGRVSKVMPVFLLSTLATAVAEHFLFGASLGLWKICCIVLILLGIVFVESGTAKLQSRLWFIYTLIAAFAAAAAGLLGRGMLGESFDDSILLAGQAAFASVFLWLFVFLRGRQRAIGDFSFRAWAGILFAALFYAGSYALTYLESLRGEISYLAPIGILEFAFVMLFARIFQKEKQPGSAVFGTLLVLLGQFGILMGL